MFVGCLAGVLSLFGWCLASVPLALCQRSVAAPAAAASAPVSLPRGNSGARMTS